MGGWSKVDPDDVVHRRLTKPSLNGIFVMSSGRPDGASLLGYSHWVLLRYIPTL